jgi:hypothetical protein
VVVVLFAFAAPAARAQEAPDYLPVFTTADGVAVKDNTIIFSAKAAKLYRTLAGRRAYGLCGAFTNNFARDYVVSDGPQTLPRKRGAVRLNTGGRPDVCALATKPKNLDDSFCRQLRAETLDWCARVIVPVTARGRAYVDRLQGVVTLTGADDQITSLPPDWAPTPVELLQGAVEADVVALDAPDAAPPTGKLGLHGDGPNHTLAILLADGKRLFLRREADVVTTNIPELIGRVLTIF